MEFELDCESKELVFKSLCDGFACSPKRLEKVLLKLDLNKIYEENWNVVDFPPADKYLYDYIVKNLGNHKPLKMVNWFHLTRTAKRNEFKDGIFPLGGILERIWNTLINIHPDTTVKGNLIFLKNNGVPNSHYLFKYNKQINWGPFAVLIKETAFNPKDIGQHDYLKMPEIIEDICNSYKEKFDRSIKEDYELFLVPKIVKFRSDKRVDTGCVKTALCYAYEVLRGISLSSNCVTCFNGRGLKIEPEAIISVTPIEN